MTNAEIDKMLTANQSPEVLLRLATVDRAIELYKDRNLVDVNDFCKSVDKIYNLLKDGKLPEIKQSATELAAVERLTKIEQGIR